MAACSFAVLPKEPYPVATLLEVNIYDADLPGSANAFPTGSVYQLAKTTLLQPTYGKWNEFDITVKDNHIRVLLNGALALDTTADPAFRHAPRGPIALQWVGTPYLPGTLRYRNVVVRRLSADP